jgi:hypothetical protein
VAGEQNGIHAWEQRARCSCAGLNGNIEAGWQNKGRKRRNMRKIGSVPRRLRDSRVKTPIRREQLTGVKTGVRESNHRQRRQENDNRLARKIRCSSGCLLPREHGPACRNEGPRPGSEDRGTGSDGGKTKSTNGVEHAHAHGARPKAKWKLKLGTDRKTQRRTRRMRVAKQE